MHYVYYNALIIPVTAPRTTVTRMHHTIFVAIRIGVTSIEFQIIHLPVGERLGIELQIIFTAGKASARVCPKVLIDAEL